MQSVESEQKSGDNLKVGNREAEEVYSFTYLDPNVNQVGESTTGFRKRIAMVGASIRRLDNISNVADRCRNNKISLFKCLLVSVLLIYKYDTFEAHQDRRKKDRHLSDQVPWKSS